MAARLFSAGKEQVPFLWPFIFDCLPAIIPFLAPPLKTAYVLTAAPAGTGIPSQKLVIGECVFKPFYRPINEETDNSAYNSRAYKKRNIRPENKHRPSPV